MSTLLLINIPTPGHWPQSSRFSALPLAAWRSLKASLYRQTLARNCNLSGHRDVLPVRAWQAVLMMFTLPQERGVHHMFCLLETTLPLLAGDTLGCNIRRACTVHRGHAPNIRRYDALFTFEPRDCCGAETALLPQRQWRFENDRMQIRFASSADMEPCQPARFGRRALPEGGRIALRGRRQGGKRRRGERSSRCGDFV